MPQSAPATPAENAIIRWCLISHTNIGKTTLTRTLLGEDVGDVRDQAHVTDSADEYRLLTTAAGNELRLWDTPGFGDSVRLQQRLAQQGNPLGWFLSNVWDRWRDKPFWMSQRAMQAARENADVILYVVNAAEEPQDTGYLDAELRILQWLEKPVLVLINQLGAGHTAAQEAHDVMRWKQAMLPYRSFVKDTLALDAFSRSWRHEQALFHSITAALSADKQAAWQDIVQTWQARNQQRIAQSAQAIADYLYFAACAQQHYRPQDTSRLQQTQRLLGLSRQSAQQAKTAAMDTLQQQLEAAQSRMANKLLQLHQLDGKAGAEIQAQLRHHFQVDHPIDTTQAGLWGAIASGAASGVGADLVAGGLTFGAGAALGALAGALTFAGAAWGLNQSQGKTEAVVTLSDTFLEGLLEGCLMQYLAVAHYGRGRGRFAEGDRPAHWQAVAAAAVQAQRTQWHALWAQARLDAKPPKRATDKPHAAGAEIPGQSPTGGEMAHLSQEAINECMASLYTT